MVGVSTTQDKINQPSRDFKIRSILGVSDNYSGLVIGGYIEAGDWIQFHLRDPKSASRQLNRILKDFSSYNLSPEGALMFTCIGRGSTYFNENHHDSQCMAKHLPSCVVGGMFCNGEIGAAKSKIQVHGYSCSIAVFSKKMWS